MSAAAEEPQPLPPHTHIVVYDLEISIDGVNDRGEIAITLTYFQT